MWRRTKRGDQDISSGLCDLLATLARRTAGLGDQRCSGLSHQRDGSILGRFWGSNFPGDNTRGSRMARNAEATGNSEPDPARDAGAYLAAVRKGMASYRTRPVRSTSGRWMV